MFSRITLMKRSVFSEASWILHHDVPTVCFFARAFARAAFIIFDFEDCSGNNDNGINRFSLKRRFQWLSYCIVWSNF